MCGSAAGAPRPNCGASVRARLVLCRRRAARAAPPGHRDGENAGAAGTPANANLATAPNFTGYNNFPSGLLASAPAFGFPFTPPQNGFAITNSIDPAIKQPYTMNMNFSIAREFPGNIVIQAAYGV